jgi:hypothetical protein
MEFKFQLKGNGIQGGAKSYLKWALNFHHLTMVLKKKPKKNLSIPFRANSRLKSILVKTRLLLELKLIYPMPIPMLPLSLKF